MPRSERPSKPAHSHPEMVATLVEELGKVGISDTPDVPTIYEEPQRPRDYLHVTVVWNKWKGVPTEERGAIILDAYEQSSMKDKLSRITLALGVTPGEAERLQLDV